MSLKVFEFFGFSPEDTSVMAAKYRKSKECPFVGGQCIKRFKSGTVSGVCAVKPVTTGPVICCPNRMYAEEYRVLLDVARTCFGDDVRLCRGSGDTKGDGFDVHVFGKRWGKELRLPGRGKGGGYFVDWVLALVDSSHKLKEFVAVELQTMDTTGSYEAEVNSLYKGKATSKPSTAGINWENVSKRILPQIIYKGHVLRREPLCTKGLFFICPTPVYQRIITRLGGSLADYHPQAGALTFRWYDLSEENTPGISRALEPGGQRTTTIDQVALAFTSPSNLPEARVYERAILAGLGS
jgi:Restriction endonuclease NotI